MNIAFDISPLKSGHFLQHRVRGTGFYTKNLMDSLQRYFPENNYVFFSRGEKIPSGMDIIHIPYFEPFFFTIPLRKRVKTVVTIHDLTPLVFPEQFPSGIKGKLRWQIQKNALKNMDGIITDSESSRKDIIRIIGIDAKKVHTVYLAAGEKFRKIENQKLKKRELVKKYKLPEKFVLYVGDITWNKNLPRLIKAVKQTEVSLVMVGKALIEKNFDKNNPWNKDRMEVQILLEEDRKEKKQILCLGFVPDDDLIQLYNLARVFVMPSVYEGFGLPILEAMNCGSPVITTREGSLPEVAGDAACFVDAYDINSIAHGIKKVFLDRNLQKIMSDRGLKHAQKFSWKNTSENTINAYKKALSRPK